MTRATALPDAWGIPILAPSRPCSGTYLSTIPSSASASLVLSVLTSPNAIALLDLTPSRRSETVKHALQPSPTDSRRCPSCDEQWNSISSLARQ